MKKLRHHMNEVLDQKIPNHKMSKAEILWGRICGTVTFILFVIQVVTKGRP